MQQRNWRKIKPWESGTVRKRKKKDQTEGHDDLEGSQNYPCAPAKAVSTEMVKQEKTNRGKLVLREKQTIAFLPQTDATLRRRGRKAKAPVLERRKLASLPVSFLDILTEESERGPAGT